MDLLQIIAGTVEPKLVIFRETAAGLGFPALGRFYSEVRDGGQGNGNRTDIGVGQAFSPDGKTEQSQIVADIQAAFPDPQPSADRCGQAFAGF